ncbi:MAG TPA: hypothetical protein DDY98_08995 [Ruminococcaceae bacterium]|nr:hypothetical protein [Oscillospiraceae bacterium]
MKMLLTDEIKDAYSSYEYPQFMVDRSPTQDLALTFDCTNCLFLACQNGKPLGNTLTLTNLSQKNGVVIKSISAQNGSLNPSCSTPFYLKPGESITVSFCASFDKAPVFDTLTVTYSNANALNKTLTKDFAFSAIDSYGGVVKTNPETKTVQSSVLGLLMCFFARVFDLLMNLFK